MIEVIKAYILQNWPLVLTLGAFVVTLFITFFASKKAMIKLLLLILSVFALSIVVFTEFYLEPVPENNTARLIMMFIRYSATPFILSLTVIVLVKHQKIFVFIPAIALLILNFVSIFTGIVFGLGENNELVRGPVGFLPYIICGLYMAFLITILVVRSNKRMIEIIPIVFLAISLSSGLIFPFIFGAAFSQIFCSIVAISLFCYYLFTLLEMTKKDTLTGLLNRQAYFIETKRDYKDITAIVSLDMNGLKRINDTEGHAAGDEALITLGLCFARACRAKQSAYRMGGDEFIIVCRKTSEEDVIKLVERIQKYVSETEYSCSIGYSYKKDGNIELSELLKQSDEKMYSDKSEYYNKK